jgi:SEC-C motif-containing protein
MRSRYAAYVQDRLDYLLQTWHPDTRPPGLEPNPPGLKWLGLDVLRHVQQDADHARVEFVARSRLAGRATRLREDSRFVRESGRWYYLDGEFPAA